MASSGDIGNSMAAIACANNYDRITREFSRKIFHFSLYTFVVGLFITAIIYLCIQIYNLVVNYMINASLAQSQKAKIFTDNETYAGNKKDIAETRSDYKMLRRTVERSETAPEVVASYKIADDKGVSRDLIRENVLDYTKDNY